MSDTTCKKLTGDNLVILKRAAKSLVAVMLHLMNKLCSIQSSENIKETAQLKKNTEEAVHNLLKKLIQGSGVIGGFVFGGQNKRSDKEITVAIHQ